MLVPRLSDSLAGRMEILRLTRSHRSNSSALGQHFLALSSAMHNHSHTTVASVRNCGTHRPRRLPVSKGVRPAKRRWYANYIDTLVQRDVRDLAHIGSLDALPKLLTLAASQTARLANISEMASQFELSRPTIRSYLTLIERLFLIEFLPPWFSNRVKRLIKSPNSTLAIPAWLAASFAAAPQNSTTSATAWTATRNICIWRNRKADEC